MFALLFALMASVFTRPRSPYFWAAFRDADGRRVQRSTKQTARAAALKVAMEFERVAEAGRARTLTEEQARRVVSDILERVTGQRLTHQTCREYFADWIAGKRGAVAEKSIEKYEQVIRDFLEHLGARADAPFASIVPRDIIAFRDKLHAGGRSAGTVNQVVRKVLSAPFFKAVRFGIISVNPCAAVEPLRDSRPSDASRQPFTAAQVGKLINAADGDWKGAILTAYTTGLRLRDIANLTWGAVDLDRRTLKLTVGKTGKEIVLPIHGDLLDWLSKQPRGIAKALLFPSLAGKGTGGRHGLSGQFRAIMDRAKIAAGVASQSGKRTTSQLSFHSLRHSFVSELANAGIASELRQKLAGHLDDKSHARYTHHEMETLRNAVAKLPKAEVSR